MPSDIPDLVKFRPLSYAEPALVPQGRRPMTIRAGLFKNLILDLDPEDAAQIRLGLHERETFFPIRQAARDSAWMIDIGAGNGALAIFFRRLPKCEIVHAFEPRPAALAIFRRNLALNNLSEDSHLVIHQNLARAPLETLQLDLDVPGFLNIDADGSEMQVLDSAAHLLTHGMPDVMVEVHSAAREEACIARLSGLGYRVKVITSAWWRFAVPEPRPSAYNSWVFAMKARFIRRY